MKWDAYYFIVLRLRIVLTVSAFKEHVCHVGGSWDGMGIDVDRWLMMLCGGEKIAGTTSLVRCLMSAHTCFSRGIDVE